MLAGQGLAQLLLDGELAAARDDQQPLVRAQPLQRGVATADQGQRARQFQASGLVHGAGEVAVIGIATQGQVAEQFLFAQAHPGTTALAQRGLARQLVETGVEQRRLGVAGGGALLVDVDCAHVDNLSKLSG
ncbi:hypothetical protein D9M69_569330 [compost metagenome]